MQWQKLAWVGLQNKMQQCDSELWKQKTELREVTQGWTLPNEDVGDSEVQISDTWNTCIRKSDGTGSNLSYGPNTYVPLEYLTKTLFRYL